MLFGIANAKYFNVLEGFFFPADALTPCELVNSVMINPQPPRLRMKRRKTVSVTPAMGASTVAGRHAHTANRELGWKKLNHFNCNFILV